MRALLNNLADLHETKEGIWITIPDKSKKPFFSGLGAKVFTPKYFSIPFTFWTVKKLTGLGILVTKKLYDAIARMYDNLSTPVNIAPQDIVYGPYDPYTRQRQIIEDLFAKRTKCVFSDVGTGKTKMFLTLSYNQPLKRIIILTENSVRHTWISESQKHYPGYPIRTYEDSYPGTRIEDKIKEDGKRVARYCHATGAKRVSTIQPYDHMVLSYSALAQKDFQDYFRKEWMPDIIICDESHNIKTKEAKTRFLMLQKLFYPYADFYMATATPAAKDYRDVITQFTLAYYRIPVESLPRFMGTYFSQFSINDRVIFKPKADSEPMFLEDVIKPWAATAQKPPDLPALYNRVLTVELSADQKEAYKKARDDLLVSLPRRKVIVSNPLQQASYLFSIATGYLSDGVTKDIKRLDCAARMEALDYILDKHPDSQILIWCGFRENVHMVREHLKKRRIKHTWTMGGMKHEEKLIEFKAGKFRVYVATYGTITTGKNIQVANVVIHFSLPKQAKDMYQSEGRIHRRGQTRECYAYAIVSKGTVESKYLRVCQGRVNLNVKIHNLRDWV